MDLRVPPSAGVGGGGLESLGGFDGETFSGEHMRYGYAFMGFHGLPQWQFCDRSPLQSFKFRATARERHPEPPGRTPRARTAYGSGDPTTRFKRVPASTRAVGSRRLSAATSASGITEGYRS